MTPSMFVTANDRAHSIALLGAVALVGFLLVGLVMWALLVWSAARKRGTFEGHAPHDLDDGKGWVLVGGILIPGASFLALLVVSLLQLHDQGHVHQMHEPSADIKLTAHRWWWQVDYLGERASDGVPSANEIHIPVGRPVRIRLESVDVIHSFWVPSLGGKADLIPGHTTATTIQADVPGVFVGQCAEFCGEQHANMKLVVIAQPAAEYERWLAHERAPASGPVTPQQIRGKEVFESAPCADCHQIRGTRAHGLMGPDLTHLGGRSTIATAAYPNQRAYLGAWMTHAQELKPGVQMPDLTVLTGDDLDALIHYLEALR